jgi:hypothetical protein
LCEIGFYCLNGERNPCSGPTEYNDEVGQSKCKNVTINAYKVNNTNQSNYTAMTFSCNSSQRMDDGSEIGMTIDDEWDPFTGLVSLGNSVILMNSQCIGEFNPANLNVSCYEKGYYIDPDDVYLYNFLFEFGMFEFGTPGVVMTNASCENAQAGCDIVVFAPINAYCVGLYNVNTKDFSCVNTTGLTMMNKFSGGAKLNATFVVFAPFNSGCVGLFDITTNAFSCVEISGPKFGAPLALSNNNVLFSPGNSSCVGRFVNETLSCITIADQGGFAGAAKLNSTVVVFAPGRSGCVGLFNIRTGVFSCELTTGDIQFSGVVVLADGNAIFSPGDTNCVGVFDPNNNDFKCIATGINQPATFFNLLWSGAALLDDSTVVFAPFESNCVGLFTPACTLDCPTDYCRTPDASNCESPAGGICAENQHKCVVASTSTSPSTSPSTSLPEQTLPSSVSSASSTGLSDLAVAAIVGSGLIAVVGGNFIYQKVAKAKKRDYEPLIP